MEKVRLLQIKIPGRPIIGSSARSNLCEAGIWNQFPAGGSPCVRRPHIVYRGTTPIRHSKRLVTLSGSAAVKKFLAERR